MAVNPNQSYAETLREMRATRMQQLRQGNTQSQVMSRQMAAMTNTNSILSKQSQTMSRLESNQRGANQQLAAVNRNLNSLSTTLSRSLSNFAASVTRGAGAGLSAAGGAVVSTASAAGSVATSIASGIAKVLPVAIAGYVVKSVSWDNMSQQTRDRISGSMGSLFSDAFKEINSTELGSALTQALTPVFDQVKKLTKKMGAEVSERVDAVREKLPSASEAKDTVIEKTQQAKEAVKSTADELQFYGKVGSRVVGELTSAELPDVGVQEVALGTAGLGAAKLVYDASKNQKGKIIPSPGAKIDDNIKKRIDAVNERRMKRREFVKANKLPGTKLDLLSGGVFGRVTKSSGKFVAAFLKSFNELKLGKTLWVIGVAMELGMTKLVEAEIDQMLEDEEITADEAKALRKWVTAQMWGSLVGGAVLGTLSGIGGTLLAGLTGGAGSVVVPAAVITGSIYGSKKGQDIATLLVDLPESITKPMNGKSPGGAHSAMANRRADNRGGGEQAISEGKADISNLPVGDVIEQYRQNVGRTEGGKLGYDAVFGAYSQADLEKYKNTQGAGGKRVSEMTIEEAIAFGRSRSKNAGALGKYQFMPSTLEGLYAKAGLKKTDLFSPENQDKLFYKFTEQNAKVLRDGGVEPTLYTLRLAHALGAGGALKMLKADPNASPAAVMGFAEGSAAYKTNPQLHTIKLKGGGEQKVTVASYLERIKKSVGGIDSTPQLANTTQLASATPTSAPSAATSTATATTAAAAQSETQEQKPAELTAEEKRKKKITDMIEGTMASMNPDRLKSDLLDSLQLARNTIAAGTTIINNDNSSSSTSSSSGGNSGGKSTAPVVARNAFEHRAMTGVMI